MIGDIVTVTVDRPLGSVHPKHEDILYAVNYCYIKGVEASDAVFGSAEDYYWGITFIDLRSVQFDTSVVAAAAFIFHDKHYREIFAGQTFKIVEESNQVGKGKVFSVEENI